ncbi:hypothetical protein Tco_0168987 [Tanacetum coccineum]
MFGNKHRLLQVLLRKFTQNRIDYEKLNSLTDDFGKHFSPQQEFMAEQAFWFHTLNPTIEPSYTPPVIVDVPSELPKHENIYEKIKREEIIENAVTPLLPPISQTCQLDLVPLPPRLLQNREAYIDYLRNTQEQANILWEIVEQAKAKQPLDGGLDLALQNFQSPRGIFINQSKYASEIVKKYGLHSTDSVDTPMIENKKLDEDLQGKQVDATLYRGIGS